MGSRSKVYFFFDNVRVTLSQRTDLKRNIGILVTREGKKLENLTYIFCSDNALLKINQQYLKHSFYTDIITFDLSERKEEAINGEVYISIDRVKENARIFNESIRNELLRVIFHGALHLCGYQDKSQAAKAIMRKKEDFYLDLFA